MNNKLSSILISGVLMALAVAGAVAPAGRVMADQPANISITAGVGGAITARLLDGTSLAIVTSGTQKTILEPQGIDVYFDIQSDTDYRIEGVFNNGFPVPAAGTRTTSSNSNISAVTAIVATFAQSNWPVISASWNSGGSISTGNNNPVDHSDSGSLPLVPVDPGGSQTIFVIPDKGHIVGTVQVTGPSVPAKKNYGNGVVGYTFSGGQADYTINATFVVKTYSLTATAAAANTGTVARSAGTDQSLYPHGTPVTLTASPAAGYSFSGWSGDVSSSDLTNNPLTVIMDGPKTVTANYTPIEYPLSISSVNGKVTRIPDNVTYHYNDVVQLTALANPGYSFSGWSGNASGATNTVGITITGNNAVTANFALTEYPFSITSTNGTVARNPNQATYHYNDVVQLTAVANPGYLFTDWSGGVTGDSSTVLITITGNNAVTANYTPIEYPLSISSVNGTVTRSPDKATYHYNDVVQLTAVADPGYSFSGWSGDATAAGNTVGITITGNNAVTANFALTEYPLGITSTNGTVTRSPDQATYHYHDVVQLTAVANPGYSFKGWGGDVTGGSTTVAITITGNNTATANFPPITFTITATKAGNGSISPATLTVNNGDTPKFMITPKAGFSIEDVFVDDRSVTRDTGYALDAKTGVATYTFANVTASHTITATFAAAKTRGISVTVSTDGSVSPLSVIAVPAGSPYTLPVTVPPGDIAAVNLDGVPLGSVTQVAFAAVNEDHTVSINITSPRGIKQSVIADLTNMKNATRDKQDVKALDDAITHLTNSINPAYWIDGAHLHAKNGDKVFSEEKDAEVKLVDLAKSNHTTLSVAALMTAIKSIALDDQLLAKAAIAEARAGDAKEIAIANQEFSNGDADRANGKYAESIEHYRNAWQHAQHAVGDIDKDNGCDNDNDGNGNNGKRK